MSARIPMNGEIKTIMRTTDGGLRLELEMTGSWGTAPRPAVILIQPGHVGVLADFVGDVLHERSEDIRLAEWAREQKRQQVTSAAEQYAAGGPVEPLVFQAPPDWATLSYEQDEARKAAAAEREGRS